MSNKPSQMIKNPWLDITESNRVLQCDRNEIDSYNKRRSDNPFCLDDFPEPFLGNKNASIILLMGNPGFDPEGDVFQYNESQMTLIKRNLTHSNEKDEFPLYFLGPEFVGHPGFAWWHKVFQPLVKELNISMAKVAKEFFCIELFGYHSTTGDDKVIHALPSVGYSKGMILNAINEGKVIIICRGVTKWLTLIPELGDYNLCSFLASNRGIALSKSTISPPSYKKIKAALASSIHGV